MPTYQNQVPINTHIFQERPFRTFLSHSAANKPLVDQIYTWLNDVANIKTWYDSTNMPPAAFIETELRTQIPQCQSLIIFLSQDSVNSHWVNFEIELALEQRKKYKQFNIIPIRLDDCVIPTSLKGIIYINMQAQTFNEEAATAILRGFFYDSKFPDVERVRDIYIARGWRVDDPEADYVCRLLDQAKFRLIGDDEDQREFSHTRIRDIISGCGGLVAILPDRGHGTTSNYSLEEIDIARQLNLPYVIVTTKEVMLDPQLRKAALAVVIHQEKNPDIESSELAWAISALQNDWKHPKTPFYTFLARDSSDAKMNEELKDLAQIVTAMPCLTGEHIRYGHKQERIRDQIKNAHYLIADISSDNRDTVAKLGVAEGANRKFDMLAKDPTYVVPPLFEDHDVVTYQNNLELLGEFHKLIRPFRRHVLNLEIN